MEYSLGNGSLVSDAYGITTMVRQIQQYIINTILQSKQAKWRLAGAEQNLERKIRDAATGASSDLQAYLGLY
jgi:hypothetical protein